MKKGLSEYKYKKIARESLINSLRLHFDSVLLFENECYPSSFQLSVLALEEFSKAKWVDHFYYAQVTNDHFPPEYDFEQEFLKYLYLHPEKQGAFIGREYYEYSPKFVKFVFDKKLEQKKQNAIYVGLERSKGKIKTESRISIPTKKIKEKDAKQIISLLNHEYLEIFNLIQQNDGYWGIWELDDIINPNDYQILFCWPHKTGLKSKKWFKLHHPVSS